MFSAALTLTACGSEADDGDAGANGSTGSTTAVATDSSSGGPGADSGTADSGTADSGSDSGDTGPALPDCPAPDESLSAAFSIEIDGTPLVLDYSRFHADVSGLPEGWGYHDTLPEIDGMCDVVEQLPASLTVTCTDTTEVQRTLTVQLDASEALSTDVGEGPVHVWYLVNVAGDMLEHVSDTAAHAFVVSDDAGIVLAGIDGRYSIDSSLGEAWPQWPDAAVRDGECVGPGDEAHFELSDGSTVDLFHGSSGDLGPYRVLVETARRTTEFDGEFDRTVPIARWLLGLPG